MIQVILISFALIAATVAIHALGLAGLTRHLLGCAKRARGIRSVTWLLVRTVWMLIFLHGLEISVWAIAYWCLGTMPDIPSAFYFSGTTYTTIGYGDLLLEVPWRMMGPLEGMTGILMSSLSGAFFFVVVSRVLMSRSSAD